MINQLPKRKNRVRHYSYFSNPTKSFNSIVPEKHQTSDRSLWTEKHLAYCLKHSIRCATLDVYQWLMLQGENVELEVDFKHEFNDWVAKKRGAPYHRDTIKRAIARLAELGIIRLGKKYSWCVWSLFVNSLDRLTKPRKKSGQRDRPRGFAPSKGSNFKTEDKQQQHKYNTLLKDVGIVFQPRYLKRLLKFTLEEIQYAIALFIHRGGHEKINNPSGWIVECLRNAWWEDQFHYLYPPNLYPPNLAT